ncbi:MAG: preprotein translocase subunit SecA [Anaerolineae bacterium]
MFKNILNKVLGDPNEKEIKRLMPLVEEVNALEPEIQRQSDSDLRALIADFRREAEETTTGQRAEVEGLRTEVAVASGDSRRRLEVELERAERALLKQEEGFLEEILPQVFAAVREASVRTIGLRHYDVQIAGGALIHQGRVVEMRTGEGKTLVATTPAVLNAIIGRGVHIITPNDYLSKVGLQWMGPIYHLLGLRVSVIQSAGNVGVDAASFQYDPDFHSSDDRYENLRPITRREAYGCDITYGTNNEFGFDYLRDNMVTDLRLKAQRELHYAIIDEIDNILIDEARTPLIISGQAEESSDLYRKFAELVRPLRPSSKDSVEAKEPDGDYVVDEKARIVHLTERGIEKMERALGVENLYDSEHASMTPYLDNALRAHVLFKRDKEYIVKDGEVIIVDEHTGRLMYGRRYSEGLHQAIEAKEGVHVRHESVTYATITFQNFFRMYDKLAGMTGTAATEAEEFNRIYDLDVSTLPTNVEFRAMQGELITESEKDPEHGVTVITYRSPDGNELYYKRLDYPDVVYRTPEAKFKAVVDEIKHWHQMGRPVLVGTIAIETSEYLSGLLRRQGVPHEVLNAKQHEREAIIITQAGRPGAVTIATNMAGRGVDILLGGNPEGLAREELRRKGVDLTEVEPKVWEATLRKANEIVNKDRQKVMDLGGLHVIGTERHEARRIDNQLRGRAGRQGDPGSSRFFVSLQDDLMRRFGGQNVANLMERLGVEDDVPIEAGLVSKSIENAQTKVEGHNFDIRKHLLEYDDVINQQREVIYAQRNRILTSPNLRESILTMVTDELSSLVNTYVSSEFSEEWDLTGLYQAVRATLPLPPTITSHNWQNLSPEEIEEQLIELAEQLYDEREERLGEETMRRLEQAVMLKIVDTLWVHHLTALDALRQGIGLRAIGQQDPLVAYKREAHEMYGQLLGAIQSEIVRAIYHPEMVQAPQPPRQMRAVHAEASSGNSGPPKPVRVEKRPGRNEPCWCGSGKKYKQCHMRQDNAGGKAAAGPRRPSRSTSAKPTSGKKKRGKRRKIKQR